jgi:phosphoribosylformimino-5-aminoimidazole carboxamide ribotide isomerase/phosphoribosylanthranilate isomerase
VLGICVGMQVMFEHGVERGVDTTGLGEWPGAVTELDAPVLPHMGWNTVRAGEGSTLFDGIEDERFYFVHSYGAQHWSLEVMRPFRAPVVTWCDYGAPFLAAVENGPLGDAVPPGEERRRGHPPALNWIGALPGSLVLASLGASRRPTLSGAMNDFASTPELILLPAVDVAGGKAVRLTQGEAGTETSYGDPVDAALAWARDGAQWIHLVDLDAAFGRGSNVGIIRKVIKQLRACRSSSPEASATTRRSRPPSNRARPASTSARPPSRTRSGRRTSSAATARPSRSGLDVRGTTLAARGWTKEGGDLWQVLDRLEDAGCSRYVVTDVTKDGTLKGPNLELLREVTSRTTRPVVASGGISNLDDIAALRDLVPLGVEARSSARPLCRAPSRSPRRWMSPQADSAASPGRAQLRTQPARGRRRLCRSGAARGTRGVRTR